MKHPNPQQPLARTPGRLRRLLAPAALLAGLLLSHPGGAQLPSMGDEEDFPLRRERILGDLIARSIYRDPDYLEDAVLNDYVQGIWLPLLDAARQSGHLTPELQDRLAWRLVLARDGSVNAFALPGGYMGVHTGLIAMVHTRSELASVLAHEISHITQRHIARSFGQQGKQTPWMVAAMILGAATLTKNPELAQAAIVGSQAAGAQGQLNFSRDMEREADRIGFAILNGAGFETAGMVDMFRKLEHANRINDSGNFPYLRTHPLTGERIADMSTRVAQGAASPSPAGPDDLLALLMAARARVLSAPGAEALHAISRLPQTMGFSQTPAPQRMAQLYAAALAASQLHDEARTTDHLQRLHQLLRQQAPARHPAVHEAVELLGLEVWMPAAHIQASRLEQALRQSALDTRIAQGMSKLSRATVLLWAQTKLHLGQARTVATELPSWLSLFPHDAQAWRLLSSAHERLGQTPQAVRADAEARAAELDYAGALERLRAAQGLAAKGMADHFEQSILQSRTQAIRQLQSEQLDNEKALR